MGRVQDLTEVLEVERLGDEVERPVAGDFRGGGHGSAGGRDDDFRRGGHGPDGPQRVGPRHPGQVEIQEDDRDVSPGKLVDALLPGAHGPDRVPEGGEYPPEEGPQGNVFMDC